MKRNLIKISGATAALLLAGIAPSYGALSLRLSADNGATWTTITDGGAGDLSSTTGAIFFSGPVGPNWTVAAAVGLSKPVTGTAGNPDMDLSIQAAQSFGAGNLLIQMSDDNFTGDANSHTYVSGIGGTTAGTVQVKTWLSSGNVLFQNTQDLMQIGPLSGSPFNGSGNSASVTGPTGNYALTMEASITHSAAGLTGFDFETFRTTEGGHGCRVTGGSNQQTNTYQSACITTTVPTFVSHGGQVGAALSRGTPWTPNSPCISGEWEHNRHLTKNSLVGVLHASGNGTVRQFDSLLCACLPCDENPGAIGLVGEVCNPGDKVCGPLPRRAPANKICFSGVGDYTFTSGKKTVPAVFRVDIEDRSEGNSQASTPPPDRYRIRIWIIDPSCGRNFTPDSPQGLALRFAASADPALIANLATTEALKVNIAPDIDDGGDMTQGNHQIHPMTGASCP